MVAVTDFYAELAETLRGIADDLAGLAGSDIHAPSYVGLTFQPRHDAPDEAKVATIDAIGRVLLGKPGQLSRMSGGVYHHDASGHRGPVTIGVYGGVAGPEERSKDEEIARLRAEVERLRGATVEPELDEGGGPNV